jgi:hypothetical protein
MSLVYRHASRAVECDRCRQSSHHDDIARLESDGWQERGFAYHLCPQCTGDSGSSDGAALWLRSDRAA